MTRITGVRHRDDEDFIAKKACSQSKEIVENDKKSTDQSNGTENDKNDFHYKPPWGWDPIPFPEDPSWAENNEINERLARERVISGRSSPPPKLPKNNLFSGALTTGLRTDANHSDKGLQQNKSPHNHIPIVTVMWKPKPRRNTGDPFALGLIVDGTIRTIQGKLISVRDLPPSLPCFNNTPITLATTTTGETSNSPSKPSFTRQLLEHKLHTLKIRYKRITQRRAKLMRAIRKTHRQNGQQEDPYIANPPPQLRGTRHTVNRKLNFFMTIPRTPDQLANAAVPWILKPVEQNTFRSISDNTQLWTVNTTTEKQVPPHPDPRLDPSQASSTEEHNPKRNETTTIDPRPTQRQ
jgi:hypothetical protein